MTRPAFLRSVKADALNFEIFSNQIVKINIAHENISADGTRRYAFDLQCAAKFVEDVEREKCDLSFVIFPVIEITVAAKAASGDAFNARDFDHWKVVGFAPVVPDKVMGARNVKMADFHRGEC